ncbi:gluconokinase [Deinococcus budaensis]|uniref:Gluconokinase n=1 Tax=Deinococcus budaensis TaxID=1665626 RepID=A0A7W8GGM6_9DEIO|nr:gluconokinase [Deinococcus budaensis]
MRPRAVIVMGVSGSGKTTLGAALAGRLGWAFADADDFHPAANREKMASGVPLTDEDRAPWLEALHRLIADHVRRERPLVLACSALKERYRRTLIGELEGVRIVFAQGSRDLIAGRMSARQHFMPVALLDSQLAALEPPQDALTVDIRLPLEENVRLLAAKLTDPA